MKTGTTFILRRHVERLFDVDSGGAHAFQCAPERTFQRRLLGMQFGGTPSTLAVGGLGKIGEFEINGESFGDAVGLFNGQAGDNLPRLIEQRVFEIQISKSGAAVSGAAARDAG